MFPLHEPSWAPPVCSCATNRPAPWTWRPADKSWGSSSLNRDLGKTVALITHNGAIAGIGKRVATIHDGQIASLRVNDHPTPVEKVQW